MPPRPYIDEEDPVFRASPASRFSLIDVQSVKNLPKTLSEIKASQQRNGKSEPEAVLVNFKPGSIVINGVRGLDGKDGKDGKDGRDGKSIQGPKGDKGERGPQGPKGEKGDPGRDGVDGINGIDGKDGSDATVDWAKVRDIAQKPVTDHEKLDHSLLHDPKFLGTKEVDEATIADNRFLKYDEQSGKLVYSPISQETREGSYTSRGGATIPRQTGNSGKYLTTNGTKLSWGTVSGTGDVVGPASSTDGNVVLFDGTTGKLLKDSGLSLSGTNTGDQPVFKTIAVSGQDNVVADSATDTLTLIAGANVTLTTNATNDSVTIAATGAAGINRSINVVSTNTTAAADASTDYVYLVSGTTTITMPTAVSNTNRYTIKNVGVNTVTVAFTGGQTGDGSATLSLPVANTSIDLISDNSNWYVV